MMRLRMVVVAVGLWVLPQVAAAKAWRGIDPGQSTRAEVFERFGQPGKQVELKGKLLLIYAGARKIKGTNQVHFRLDSESGVVERVDVYPGPKIERRIVEATYGPACGPNGPADKACYLEKRTDTGREYLAYEALGLAVFLNPAEQRKVTVFSFAYTAPKTEEAAPSTATRQVPGNEPQAAVTTTVEEQSQPGLTVLEPPGETGGGDQVEEAFAEDPLAIGGLFYVRGEGAVGTHTAGPKLTGATAPMLADVYFDGRPNDRLRGMLRGRLVYDPSLPPGGGLPSGGEEEASEDGLGNPSVLLDQLWLSFDLGRKLYFTVGRQRVKWGTARFWTPTDFLTPLRTNPLARFDDRIGTDMIRVAIPWTDASTTFTVVGLTRSGSAAQPVRFGGALRAETVQFGAELAISAMIVQQEKPRYGLELSTALGPVDVHADVALRHQLDVPLYRPLSSPPEGTPYPETFAAHVPTGPIVMASGGVTFTRGLNEQSNLTFFAEGFYNSEGYDSSRIIPFLITQDAYQPFYTGRMYAALGGSYSFSQLLESYDITASVVGNLSDRSYLGRLEVALQLIKDLQLETFLSVPFGRLGGELRMGGPQPVGPTLPTPVVEVGIGLLFNV